MTIRRRDMLLTGTTGLLGAALVPATAVAQAKARTSLAASATTLHMIVRGAAALAIKMNGEKAEHALIGFLKDGHHDAILRLTAGEVADSSTHPQKKKRRWDVSKVKLSVADGGQATDLEPIGLKDVRPGVPPDPDVDDRWRSLGFFPTVVPDCSPKARFEDEFQGSFRLTAGRLLGEPPSKKFAREVGWIFRTEDLAYNWSQAMSDGFRYVLLLSGNTVTIDLGGKTLILEAGKYLTDRIELELSIGNPEAGEPGAGEPLDDFRHLKVLFDPCEFPMPYMPGTPHFLVAEQQRVRQPGKYCTGLRFTY